MIKKAVILNSGEGKRMGDFTSRSPKCLAEIANGTSILSLQLTILSECGMDEFVITTGPNPSLIEDHVKSLFPGIRVAYVNNPDYAATNYIYSMYLAKELIQNDIILIHGDIVTEKSVCERLLGFGKRNAAVVRKPAQLPKKDFKARIKNGSIIEIGVSCNSPEAMFLLPFYKLSKEAMALWLSEIGKYVRSGNSGVYAEEAFNDVSSELELSPFLIGEDEICMEVDDIEDLDEARRRINVRRNST